MYFIDFLIFINIIKNKDIFLIMYIDYFILGENHMSIIPQFLDEALTPVAKESGERLADIVSLVFTPIIKAKAIRDKNLEKFLKELDEEINKIPENRVKEPPLHIVRPALEDVIKYYCDEEYLRKMFARLISSSMDSDNIVHPSYIDIIKQLSPSDSAIFRAHFECSTFKIGGKPQNIFYQNAIKFYHLMHKEINCFEEIENFVFWENESKFYWLEKPIIISLHSLKRLGLINISLTKIPKMDLEKYKVREENLDGTYVDVLVLTSYPTQFGLNFANICCGTELNKNCFIKDKNEYIEGEVVIKTAEKR